MVVKDCSQEQGQGEKHTVLCILKKKKKGIIPLFEHFQAFWHA